MPLSGQVYRIKVPSLVGPWSRTDIEHPGLIVSRNIGRGAEPAWVLVPMTGTRPLHVVRSHVQVDNPAGSLTGPLWVQCEYPITVPGRVLERVPVAGTVSAATMAIVKQKLRWVFEMIGPGEPIDPEEPPRGP